MTSRRWQLVSREQYGCSVYLSFFSCRELPREAWVTKGPAGWRRGGAGGGVGWAMDALSITPALAGGLRSRHAAVRERWSVRSQHSLTPPDPSSGQGRHRICLRKVTASRMASSTLAKAQCADREEKVVRGLVRMVLFRGFGESKRNLEQDRVLAERKKNTA